MRLIVVILVVVGLLVSTVVNFVDVSTLPSGLSILLLVFAIIGALGGLVQQFFPQWLDVPSGVPSTEARRSSSRRRSTSSSSADLLTPPSITLPPLEKVWFRLGLMLLPFVLLIPLALAFTFGSLNTAGENRRIVSEAAANDAAFLVSTVALLCVFSFFGFIMSYYREFALQREIFAYMSAGPLILFEIVLLVVASFDEDLTLATSIRTILVLSLGFVFYYYISLPVYLWIVRFIKSVLWAIGLKFTARVWFWLFALSYVALLFMGIFGEVLTSI